MIQFNSFWFHEINQPAIGVPPLMETIWKPPCTAYPYHWPQKTKALLQPLDIPINYQKAKAIVVLRMHRKTHLAGAHLMGKSWVQSSWDDDIPIWKFIKQNHVPKFPRAPTNLWSLAFSMENLWCIYRPPTCHWLLDIFGDDICEIFRAAGFWGSNLGMISLINYDSSEGEQWGRYNLPRYDYIYICICMYIYRNIWYIMMHPRVECMCEHLYFIIRGEAC